MNKNELLPFEEEPREIIPREMIGAEIALAKAKGFKSYRVFHYFLPPFIRSI